MQNSLGVFGTNVHRLTLSIWLQERKTIVFKILTVPCGDTVDVTTPVVLSIDVAIAAELAVTVAMKICFVVQYVCGFANCLRVYTSVYFTVNGFQMVGSNLFSAVKPTQKIY